jgi:hypothetical protein
MPKGLKIEKMKVPENFEEVHNPFDYERSFELEIGKSLTGMFEGIHEYEYQGKRCFNLRITDASDGRVRQIPISTKLRYISALCVDGKTWVRLTRLPDVSSKYKKNPMKDYKYEIFGDRHNAAEISAIFSNNEWDKVREKKKREKKKI